QELACPACHATLFVLPASVYPRPRVPLVVLAKPRPPKNVEPEPVEQPAAPTVSEKTARRRARKRGESPAETTPAPKPPPLAVAVPRRRRKWITPLRVVLISICLLVTVMTWWLIHARAVDR